MEIINADMIEQHQTLQRTDSLSTIASSAAAAQFIKLSTESNQYILTGDNFILPNNNHTKREASSCTTTFDTFITEKNCSERKRKILITTVVIIISIIVLLLIIVPIIHFIFLKNSHNVENEETSTNESFDNTTIITTTNTVKNIPDFFVTRHEWGAKKLKNGIAKLSLPIKRIIIAHTAGISCFSETTCKELVKQIENSNSHLDDIPYNFLIGGDVKPTGTTPKQVKVIRSEEERRNKRKEDQSRGGHYATNKLGLPFLSFLLSSSGLITFTCFGVVPVGFTGVVFIIVFFGNGGGGDSTEYNSIGICITFIGNYATNTPSEDQLKVFEIFLEYFKEFIEDEYIILKQDDLIDTNLKAVALNDALIDLQNFYPLQKTYRRKDWNAEQRKAERKFYRVLDWVILSHTVTSQCNTVPKCATIIKTIQTKALNNGTSI
ncbi:hypothetical protein PVAND_006527 [Polypedilum vanderplanki]|uniref:Peptidoglycan recognition protein family domain-containing protein n=1 Tax=Polypedilum vanderplanki TaxID=319348 RepID=A0A9J6C3X6_POLVA|nr:hypothetical protein PVAND_006527 [Polypedilum vanderplanki]